MLSQVNHTTKYLYLYDCHKYTVFHIIRYHFLEMKIWQKLYGQGK